MAKNDNAHSLRLTQSLAKHVGAEAAAEFEAKLPLSKSADFEKKFEWAKNVCDYLEERFDPDTIAAVRHDCRCNDGKSNAAKLMKYLNKSASIAEFVEVFNRGETFARLEYISERKLLFCYPECYCSCVKRVPEQISKTWCLCTIGNAEGIFHEVFGDGARVRLLDSIKRGGSECVIEVEW